MTGAYRYRVLTYTLDYSDGASHSAGRHGGSSVSAFLRKSLPALVEASNAADIPTAIDAYRALGGYLKRYRGGPLGRFRIGEDEVERHKALGLDEMCVLAFLQVSSTLSASSSGLI
jgi:protein phosphatase PTC6